MPIYDCDSCAKALMTTDSQLQEELIQLVGKTVYQANGSLNKTLLAEYLFSSEAHARAVNAIVHPAVRRDFQRWSQEQTAPVVGMESAILYESGFDEEVDKVLYIDAPMELRIERAMRRDGASRQQIEQRICRQESDKYRCKADIIFVNDGKHDLVELISNIK